MKRDAVAELGLEHREPALHQVVAHAAPEGGARLLAGDHHRGAKARPHLPRRRDEPDGGGQRPRLGRARAAREQREVAQHEGRALRLVVATGAVDHHEVVEADERVELARVDHRGAHRDDRGRGPPRGEGGVAPHARGALRVGVDEQHLATPREGLGGQADREGALARAALLPRDGDEVRSVGGAAARAGDAGPLRCSCVRHGMVWVGTSAGGQMSRGLCSSRG